MPDRLPSHRPTRQRPGTGPRHRRDAFYSSRTWRKLRRAHLLDHPLCERCLAAGRTEAAGEVHHRIPRRARPDLALDPGNLEALCKSCHSREELRRRLKRRGEEVEI